MAFIFSCSHSQSEEKQSSEDVKAVSILDSLGIDSEIARNPKFHFQMVATSVVEGKIRKSVSYGTDQYYYPASLVKIPAALVLLEILNERNISLNAIPIFDTVNACGSTRFVELSQEKRISFRQMLRELIVVSDNHFYNALYHFITPKELNKRLKEKGYEGVKIYRAFTGCDVIDQLRTYPLKVYAPDLKSVLYEQEASILDSNVVFEYYTESKDRMFGSKHENKEGDIVDGPYDLNFHIEIPLEQMHRMMLSVFYSNQFSQTERWNVRGEDLTFIQEMLGTFPSEISSSYRKIDHFDDFEYKYVPSNKEKGNRTFGKLGLSYGFASESVYVPTDGIGNGLLLSYSVYVNSNDIVNDGEYDYESVARPFAKDLFTKMLEWHLNEN